MDIFTGTNKRTQNLTEYSGNEKKDEKHTFRGDWKCFEEKFGQGDTTDLSPKFGTDWEQFHGDSEETYTLKTRVTSSTGRSDTEVVPDNPKSGKQWEMFEKETPMRDNSVKDQSKTNDESNSKRISAFEEFARIRLRAASLQGIYHIHTKEEKYVCEITDICKVADEILLITDFRNKSIKKLGINYDLTECLKLPDRPFGVCKVDKTQVAVTLVTRKKVQFVSIKKKMALRKSFNVRDCCRGITYCAGLFYICCGGSSDFDSDGFEGQGRLEVYSPSGIYLSTFNKGISSPRYVCVNEDSTRIFVTDHYNGIIVQDMEGRLVSQISHDKCTYPSGICSLNKEQFCVAFHQRNEILSVDESGEFKQVLLQRKEGLMAPRAVCYDIHRSRLIVSTMWGDDTIKVFNLHLTRK